MSVIDEDRVFRVSGGSDPIPLATAISKALIEEPDVVLRAVGAAASNQATKAIAIARGHVASRGGDLVCRPAFQTVPNREGDGEISALVFRVTTI